MPATLTASANPRVDVPMTIDGDGFAPSTKVTLTVYEGHRDAFTVDFLTDASGSFSSTDEPDPAVGTLTSNGTNVSNADTVTIDGRVYTFKTTLTPTANEVLIGATAAASLQNLKDAINLTGTPGTQYAAATTIHATVSAGAITATTLLVFAKTGGTGGNSLATTKSATTLSWGGGTLAGGGASTGRSQIVITPSQPGPYTFSGTDGTSTATTTAYVST